MHCCRGRNIIIEYIEETPLFVHTQLCHAPLIHLEYIPTQMKRRLTRMERIRLKGWRAPGKSFVSGRSIRNSQLGQVLFYLTAIQLQRVQLYLKDQGTGPLNKALGIFSEEGKVCSAQILCLLLMCLLLTCSKQNKKPY